MYPLKEVFKNKKRIAICGIGNNIRGDDAFGILVVENLKKNIKDKKILLLNCGEIPENYGSKIIDFKPDLVVFIDAVDFKGKVGEYIIADPEGTIGETVSTHNLPLKIFVNFIKNMHNAEFVLIGCQPGSLNLFEEPSDIIKQRAEKLANLISTILLS